MASKVDPYFSVSWKKPDSSASVPVRGAWLILRQKIEDWPQDVQKDYAHHIRRCMHLREANQPVYREGEVTLCLHSSCLRKRAGTDDPHCGEYAVGLCCEATLRNNQSPLSSEVLRIVYGKNPAQMKQDIQREIERLLQSVLSDPVLCEAIECLGLDAVGAKIPA